MIWSGWEAAFLQAIGAQPTAANVSFLDAWAQREEPYSTNPNAGYTYNPLNTTWPGGPVQNYGSVSEGIAAFAKTLTSNPGYQDLLAALRGGNPSTSTNYNGLGLWSGHSYYNLAGITGPSSASAPAASSTSTTSSQSSASSSTGVPWLDSIASLPFGIGPGVESVVSSGLVLAGAITFLLIGGIWLIMGNENTRTIVVNTTKAAGEATAGALAA